MIFSTYFSKSVVNKSSKEEIEYDDDESIIRYLLLSSLNKYTSSRISNETIEFIGDFIRDNPIKRIQNVEAALNYNLFKN